jgi:hypothetical protein
MAKRVRTFGREAAGWSLIVLAIIFFPVPFLPTLLVVSALLILSAHYDWAKELLARLRESFPQLFPKKAETAENATTI